MSRLSDGTASAHSYGTLLGSFLLYAEISEMHRIPRARGGAATRTRGRRTDERRARVQRRARHANVPRVGGVAVAGDGGRAWGGGGAEA
mgnify:CR=1 FL=1